MKRIFRERFDKKLGGVCGGLGQYLRIDPSIIRLLVIFFGVLTAVIPVVICYLIAYLIIPLGPTTYIQQEYRRLKRSKSDRKLAGLCGGIGKYLKIDSTIVRISMIVLMFLSLLAPVAITYIVGAFIVPEEG